MKSFRCFVVAWWFACVCCLSWAKSPPGSKASGVTCPATPDVDSKEPARTSFTGVPGTVTERSFFAVKPDGVQRGLVGEVMSRFERKGWKLVGLKMLTASRSLTERHYEEHVGKAFFDKLLDYMSSGPVVAMVWEGTNVIAGGRKMLGSTNPLDAEVGSIRGDLCVNPGRNLVHASDSPESAEREIALWFREEETIGWSRSTDPWILNSL